MASKNKPAAAAINPFKIAGLADGLFQPIHKAIELVLPKFVEKNLQDPKVRKAIVAAADKALLSARPEVRLIPKATRQRIIGKALDLLLDEIVLPN